LFLAFCTIGFTNMQLTSDPQELWVPPSSRANIEQDYFKEKFGPFFRINTIWLTPGKGQDPEADVFQKGYLEMLFYLQNAIEEGEA
jgi:Niemann-Pick C1 protein